MSPAFFEELNAAMREIPLFDKPYAFAVLSRWFS